MTESVRVMVRCRPMNQKQIQMGCANIVEMNKSTHQIGLKKLSSINTTVKYFAYDYVFGQQSTQQEVYEQSSFSLVENVLNGYNGTIFAYGQTGCGKTHTMLGVTTTLSTKKAQMISQNKQNLPVTVTSLKLSEQTMGIVPRAFHQIMTVTNSQQSKNHLIQCTFLQIYNEQIHDLLGKDIKAKINIQQTPDGLIMKDLSVHLAKNVSDMQKFMQIGYKNRVIRQTSMNKQSSRSHCIFTIRIQESQFDSNGVQRFRVGKLNLVDLAGSQRQSKTNLKDEGIKQAAKINLSLSALGNVISALVDGRNQHIPYRDSKLTRILNDSLGGNTKTVMIATIAPSDYNYEETLSTLRYSSRAKYIQNKPTINQDPKDALLRKYEQQISRLKMILEGKLPYVRGNQTFYISAQKKQQSIFSKFPELKNEQNEAIMREVSQLQENINKLNDNKDQLSDGNNDLSSNLNEFMSQSQQLNVSPLINNDPIEVQSLKKQLKFLQEMVKKQVNTSPEVLQQLEKINQLKQKLRQQAIREEKYKQQEKKRQEQLLNIEKNYQNLNQEVDSIKQKFEELRIKYVQTNEELKDSRESHEKEKEDILDALRIQQAQNNKLMEILNVILPSEQLQKLFKKCEWINNTKQWIVPKFQFTQNRQVAFQKERTKRQDRHAQNTRNKKGNLIDSKKVEQQLQNIQKLSKANKLNNLIVQQSQKFKISKRKSQSQRKLMVPEKSQSVRQSIHKNVNPFQSVEKEKQGGFKNSYYSEQNVNGNGKGQFKLNSNTLDGDKLKQGIDKYKFSLKPLPKVKNQQQQNMNGQRPVRVSLDLQQLKRQIMNEMRQKNNRPI